MPNYMDKHCQGTCEQFGLTCQEPELYAEIAARYNAEPVKPSGTMKIDGREVPWSYWNLHIPEDQRKDAIQGVLDEHRKRFPTTDWTDEELRPLIEHKFLRELPCYLECHITICGFCGRQHGRELIKDGTCVIRQAVEQEKENIEKNQDDLETIYQDPRWPKENDDAKD